MARSLTILRVVYLALFLLGILALVYAYAWYDGMSSRVEVPFSATDDPISEQTAIEVTRRALDLSGANPDELVPRDSTDSETYKERIFARNPNNLNSGYVLWKYKDSKNANKPGYMVRLEKTTSGFECFVGIND